MRDVCEKCNTKISILIEQTSWCFFCKKCNMRKSNNITLIGGINSDMCYYDKGKVCRR
jgi:hypothetical protein